jgi:hypothetical protein
MNDELVRWFGEQLDEDERIAKEAGGHRAEWRLARPLDDAEMGDASWLRPPELKHAERHNPAWVLRDIAAKRQLLEKASAGLRRDKSGGTDGAYGEGLDDGMLEAVKFLATPYADRTGYREEWRP